MPAFHQSTDKVPIDSCKTEDDFVFAVLYNSESFDHRRFQGWLHHQSKALQRVAKLCSPTGVYRLKTDGRICCITGYKTLGADTAGVVVMLFGERDAQLVDVDQLENVTVWAKGLTRKSA